jgi:UDP-glucuronate 4-epimerase
MMDPVLVTGTAGLVGFHVARRLHEDGIDVLGLDARPAPADAPFPSRVGDITSLEVVMQAMSGRPNVVHAAAISGPMLMLDDPHGIARANLGGAMAVFEASWRADARRLVWMSSIAVYGDQPTLDPIDESAPPNPQSFYGHTKAAGEALLRGYVTHYGLQAVALRLSSVYGVRRQTACRLRGVVEAAISGQPIEVAAEGSSFRQYLHVADAADAVFDALSAETVPGFAYNITGGTYVTEADLARMIGAFLPALIVKPGPAAWNEGHLGPLTMTAAERDLGYRPHVTLETGLRELCEHLLHQRGAML